MRQGRVIRQMEAFAWEHRDSYLNPGSLTENQRDEIEVEFGELIKKCKQSIELLTAQLEGGKV